MPAFDDQQRGTAQEEIRSRLWAHRNLMDRSGAFYAGDDSFPRDSMHRQKSWRCLPMSRIGILLSGRHDIAFARKSTTIEASVRSGDVWFLPANTHDDEMFAHPCCYMSAVFFQNYTRFVVVNCDGPSKNYPAPVWFHLHEERPSGIESALEALHKIATEDTGLPAGNHLCRALWLLLGEWIRQGGEKEARSPGKAASAWTAVERIIQENYHRPINRQTVADSLKLHPNRISQLCRRFGMDSFQHLLEKRRLQQARRFLENSDAKIEAVAIMCGFSGVTYFTRVFGRANGMSPGEWRRRHDKQNRRDAE